jgi:hypothetical protein
MGSELMNPRAISVRRALDEWHDASENWIEKTLTLASELYAARQECGDNDRNFGMWLFDNGCDDLGRDARAALINLGKHSALSRQMMERSPSRSVELLWDQVKQHLSESSDRSSTPETTISSAKPTDLPKKTETAPNPSPAKVPAIADPLGAMIDRKLPKAEIVCGSVLDPRARQTLVHLVKHHRKAGLRVWELLIQSIESGVFGPPIERAYFTTRAGSDDFPVGLRILIPWFSKRLHLNLLKSEVAEFVGKVLLPAIAADRDRFLTNPDALDEAFIRSIRTRHENEMRAKAGPRLPTIKKESPPQEYPIIAYGTPLWPRADDLTFDEVRHAVWFFDFLVKHYRDRAPGSARIATSHLLKFIFGRQSGWDRAVRLVIQAYEKNPDGETRCELPPNFFHRQ